MILWTGAVGLEILSLGGLKAKADILGLTEDALYYDVFGKLRNPEYLKKFYRTLSKAFHPDSNQGVDATEEMKMLNRLKSDWGV